MRVLFLALLAALAAFIDSVVATPPTDAPTTAAPTTAAPTTAAPTTATPTTTAPTHGESNSQMGLGLGIGLPLGILVLIAIGAACYHRRVRRGGNAEEMVGLAR